MFSRNRSIITLIQLALITCFMLFSSAVIAKENSNPYPDVLKKWVSEGQYMPFQGLNVFVHASGTAPVKGHGVLIVHGFPGSSWDWQNVVSIVEKHTRVVVIDMLGFGNSSKPMTGTYKENFSLMRQADLYEAVAKAEGFEEVILVAHDMGQTVGLELMTRHDEGKLPFKIRHAILLDGSTLVDMVKLVPLQVELLKQPDQAATEHLDFAEFAEGLRGSFYKVTDETLDAMAQQVFANDGDLVIGQTLRYLNERKEYYDRWVGTLTNFRTAPLSLYWGVHDPVAVIAMADRIKMWSPTTDLYKLQNSGHWPSIEVPEVIGNAIVARMPIY
jgi:pimeloyl-ACP methyl ester carboxylesterase